MKTPDDLQAHDLFLDRLLAEELGGERPADRTARILGADAAARAQAAADVDAAAAAAAAEPTPDRAAVRGTGRLVRLAMAACVLVGLALGVLWSRRAAAPELPQDPQRRFAVLLDEFHRVMPVEPPALRDAARRQRIAPAALPVLREMIAGFAASPGASPWADRAPEFTIYALVLGDADTRARVEADARNGRATARILQAAAAVITADDETSRGAALDRVMADLREPSDEVRGAVTCLLTAADLSADEALRLAGATADEALARRLRIGAELADGGPQRLVGKPFELAGRLHTGEQFSSSSLRGKVVLVFFWASWCGPCATALPEVVAVAQRHAGEGLAVVGVSCDHDREDLSRFLAAHPEVTWPQLFDATQPGWHELAFWSGVRAVPRTFLVDRRGILREIHTRGDLERLVQKLLAE